MSSSSAAAPASAAAAAASTAVHASAGEPVSSSPYASMYGSTRGSIIGAAVSPTAQSDKTATAGGGGGGGVRLGLRRSSWQAHLSPRVQKALATVAGFMDGPVVLCMVVVATLMAIFLEDIKVLSFSRDDDYSFECITMFLFVLFLSELLINCIVKAGYLGSFFFWLDVVSAFSLLPDIPWIWAPMIGLQEDGSSSTASLLRQVRQGSRTQDKLLHVLKFVRLIRLGRIAKLFEMAQRALEERERARRRELHADDNTIHAQDYTESSQVGSALSEQTTRKVVLLVLVMMLVIPQLQPTVEEHAEKFSVTELNWMAGSTELLTSVYARKEADGSTFTALPSNETSTGANGTRVESATGTPLVEFDAPTLIRMLEGYDTNSGQPLDLSDPYALESPQFNETYISSLVGAANFSVALASLTHSRDAMEQQFRWSIAHFKETIVYLHIRGKYFSNDFLTHELNELRINEMTAAEDSSGDGGNSFGIFSHRSDAQLEAMYSIIRTLIVLVLLTAGAVAFNRNNKKMVIEPIERMVATIVQLQKNPLARAVIDADAEDEGPGGGGDSNGHNTQNKGEARPVAGWTGIEPLDAILMWIRTRLPSRCVSALSSSASDEGSVSAANETGMLEKTLEKLTGLLQVGFGEAGSRMISKCMNANADGDLDPLVDGNRMLAIFGFCDIRRFTDATECLKEDVMMYVNEIASIVHSHVSSLDGHPNKNVGDAFLVIWRLKPANTHMDPDDLFQLNERQPVYLREQLETVRKRAALQTQAERDYALQVKREREQRLLVQRAKQASASMPPIVRPLGPLTLAQLSVQADKAVVAFLRVIVDLDASAELRAYEQDPRILAAFGSEFLVQLGFGLHCGWAIEGPIGSRYKIDASYLSPHVNLSEALQDLTKEYGTPLLVSGEFYTLLSPYLKSFMRRVDVVRVAGRDVPMNLYAFDMHADALKSVIARTAPAEYDRDADIEVVELKSSFFSKTRVASTHDDPNNDGGEPTSPMSADPMESPLSPGPVRHVADPLQVHPLFSNPYLNPTLSDFGCFEYSGAARKRMHQTGPVATYHLVYNFRLQVLQCGIPYEFQDEYAAALQLYLDGDWPAARTRMERAQAMYPGDKPTKVILEVMAEHDFVAPSDWAGWHDA